MISRKRLERNINLIIASIFASLIGMFFYHSDYTDIFIFLVFICVSFFLLIVEYNKLRSFKRLDAHGYRTELRGLENRFNQLSMMSSDSPHVARFRTTQPNKQVYICSLRKDSWLDKALFGLSPDGLIIVMESLSEHSAILHFYTFYRNENYLYCAIKSFDKQNPNEWNEINFALFQASGSKKNTGDLMPVDQIEVNELVDLLSNLSLVENRGI